MGRAHSHGHVHGHIHGHGANRRALAIASLLTGGFMVAEVVGGVLSGSLALLADAGHMLTDFAALVLAWLALRLAERPADWKRSYGFDRFSVLAAFVNGVSLFAIAVWIGIEAVRRFLDPSEVEGDLMFGVAVTGLLVNVASFWILSRGDRTNLNLRAASLHVAGDLLGSVAAIVASVVILGTGWTPIDPILSVLVALLILRSAYAVVRDSGHILLQGTPEDIDPQAVADALCAQIDGVVGIEHVHVWCITQERQVATLEARLAPEADRAKVRERIKSILSERYGIGHVTVELLGGASEAIADREPASAVRCQSIGGTSA